MAKLTYSAITSLDGYVADERGEFGWAARDEDVHSSVSDAGAAHRQLPVRAPDVRDDGLPGDRSCHR
jgi:hypothetical protein